MTEYRSATDGVPQNEQAVAEPALFDQLQLQPHTIREEPCKALRFKLGAFVSRAL